jgi:hypothetical protein
MGKTRSLTGEASITAHNAKKGKEILKLAVDFSPGGFLTRSRTRKQPLHLELIPEDKSVGIAALHVAGVVKGCAFELEDLAIPDDRLADLRFLRNEATPLRVKLIATETQDRLPGIENEESDNIDGGGNR